MLIEERARPGCLPLRAAVAKATFVRGVP